MNQLGSIHFISILPVVLMRSLTAKKNSDESGENNLKVWRQSEGRCCPGSDECNGVCPGRLFMMCPLPSPSSVITDQIVKTIQMQIVPRLFILVPLVRILRSQLVHIYQEKENT